MSGSLWSRIGWLVRLLFSPGPSILANWFHNAQSEIVMPGPATDWLHGTGSATGVYRSIHSCYQCLGPPEVYVLLTDDNGQAPTDTSVNDLLARGYPPVALPNQRFTRATKLLYSMRLCRCLPDRYRIRKELSVDFSTQFYDLCTYRKDLLAKCRTRLG